MKKVKEEAIEEVEETTEDLQTIFNEDNIEELVEEGEIENAEEATEGEGVNNGD